MLRGSGCIWKLFACLYVLISTSDSDVFGGGIFALFWQFSFRSQQLSQAESSLTAEASRPSGHLYVAFSSAFLQLNNFFF